MRVWDKMTKRSETEKMLAGEFYSPHDAELAAAHKEAVALIRIFNASDKDEEVLRRLLGRVGENPVVEPPFYCDYGRYIFAGDNLYMNIGCVILDCNEVHIGDNVMFAPYVQIYAAFHPVKAEERLTGLEYSKPVHIGNNVWLGGGSIILPGVTVGENTTIGAGSVVTRDVPPNVVAAGNPCRVIREI